MLLCVYVCSVVLLVSPDEDILPEVQSVSEHLSSSQFSNRDVTVQLVLRCFQSVLGAKGNLEDLYAVLQVLGKSSNVHQTKWLFCCRSM